jgi:hypothetical protein
MSAVTAVGREAARSEGERLLAAIRGVAQLVRSRRATLVARLAEYQEQHQPADLLKSSPLEFMAGLYHERAHTMFLAGFLSNKHDPAFSNALLARLLCKAEQRASRSARSSSALRELTNAKSVVIEDCAVEADLGTTSTGAQPDICIRTDLGIRVIIENKTTAVEHRDQTPRYVRELEKLCGRKHVSGNLCRKCAATASLLQCGRVRNV